VIFGNMGNGLNPLTVRVPLGASTAGYFYMRFRLYDGTRLTAISSSGLARGGEVEDYRLQWQPTAVQLLSFTATARSDGIFLTWETATEHDNLGFNLYRSQAEGVLGERLNGALIPSKAPGQGGGATYQFIDIKAGNGVTCYYTLEDVDISGRRTAHGPVAVTGWRFYFPLVGK